MRRLKIEAPSGFVANEPEAALSALVAVAESEGVDPGEWLEKALRDRGATRIGVPVSREPRFRVVEGVEVEALKRYRRCMATMQQAISDRLEQAGKEAKKRAKDSYKIERG